MRTIFIDLDGVLADFDAGYKALFGSAPDKLKDDVDWERVNSSPHFYANLPIMHGAHTLVSGVTSRARRNNATVCILTGTPSSVKTAVEDKLMWVRNHFGDSLPVICCKSAEKSLHMRRIGDILIDDWDKYRVIWETRGGLWIPHLNAANSLMLLDRHLEMSL